jgi:transmembrane sensor
MKPQTGKQLLEKFKSGTINEDERALLETWYLQYADQADSFNDAERYEQDIASMRQAFPFNKPAQSTRRILWPRMGMAAAAVILILGIGLFYQWQENKQAESVYNKDVAPGKQGATLKLANGQTIRLGQAAYGELASQAGVRILKSKDGSLIYEINAQDGNANPLNTLSTANGETYQIRLPDGSMVWLNAGSSLTYHAKLIHEGKRSVVLSGEGYFEVAKDKTHPFIVAGKDQEIAVLGTHFNVRNYADETIVSTTLLEGSVKIIDKAEQSIMLKPGQQAKLKAKTFAVTDVDTEDAVAWKNGMFVLNNQDLESILKQASRWYNVEIGFEDEALKTEVFRGSVSRFENISQLLEVLESTGSVHFKWKGRRIIAIK